MSPLLFLVACGSMDKAYDGEDGKYPHDGTPPGGPALQLVEPARASYLPAAPARVSGVAREMSQVTLDGQGLSPSGGAFSAEVPLLVGVNTFEVAGVDPDGLTRTDMGAVLAGEFTAPSGLVRDAAQVHVSAAGLAAAGPLVGGLLDPAAFDATIQALNPLIDDATARVTLGTLAFGPPVVDLVPVQDAVALTVHLPDFVLPVDATIYDALPFGIDLDLAVDIAADDVVLTTTVVVRPDGQGGLVVEVGAVDAELAEFDLDTGILELVDWLFLDDDDLAAVIEGELAGLGPSIETMVADLIAGLDLELEMELLEQVVTVSPSFDAVAIDPGGVALSVGVAIDVAGAPDGKVLFLGAPPATQGGEVHVQIADDLLERGLYELWAAGALDLEMPLVDEAAVVLALFGGKDSGTMTLAAGLPPVWVERDGVPRLQLGEVGLLLDTPGGLYGDRVEIVMTLDAKADLSVTAEAAGIVLSDAKVAMRLSGDSVGNAALEEKLPSIEAAFGLGVGLINSLLSFPLVGVLPEGTVLPPLAFPRDPSGRATVLDLAIADLGGLLGGTSTAPPTTTTTPTGPVAIPGTAEVLDDDGTVAVDGSVGWVCEDREVTVEADGGTWYVDPDAELVLRGTGHVVYASDDSRVTLEAPGNTVYADPGADVRDDDGTNTVIEVDPLELDLAGAPTPGCG